MITLLVVGLQEVFLPGITLSNDNGISTVKGLLLPGIILSSRVVMVVFLECGIVT